MNDRSGQLNLLNMALPLAGVALVSAALTTVVSLGLGLFRHIDCGADAIVVIRPLLGGPIFNALLYAVLTFTLLAWWDVLAPRRGRRILRLQTQDNAFASASTWVVRLLSLGWLATALSSSGRTEQICVSDAGFRHRMIIGSERFYPWNAVAGVVVTCSFADGGSQGIMISMRDGSKLAARLGDIAGIPASQIGFWDRIYDDRIPITFGAFETGKENGTAGCWPLFPGLQKS